MKSHLWTAYSSALQKHILNPSAIGSFANPSLFLAMGHEDTPGNRLTIYLLIDEEDGIIADARFQAFGDTALIGIADMACAAILRKSYIQASHLTLELPEALDTYFNLVLSAIQDAASHCSHISATPITLPTDLENLADWDTLSHAEKLSAIKETIAREIQPYIELDAGGVQVLSLEDNHITIAYEGTCTSCHAATGSTLTAIQQILRTKLHKDLTVTPDLSLLNLEDPGY